MCVCLCVCFRKPDYCGDKKCWLPVIGLYCFSSFFQSPRHTHWHCYSPSLSLSLYLSDCPSHVHALPFFYQGGLQSSDSSTVGILDLGGGSTQITFSPKDEVRTERGRMIGCSNISRFILKLNVNTVFNFGRNLYLCFFTSIPEQKTIQISPVDDIRSFQVFNKTHTLYAHRYTHPSSFILFLKTENTWILVQTS